MSSGKRQNAPGEPYLVYNPHKTPHINAPEEEWEFYRSERDGRAARLAAARERRGPSYLKHNRRQSSLSGSGSDSADIVHNLFAQRKEQRIREKEAHELWLKDLAATEARKKSELENPVVGFRYKWSSPPHTEDDTNTKELGGDENRPLSRRLSSESIAAALNSGRKSNMQRPTSDNYVPRGREFSTGSDSNTDYGYEEVAPQSPLRRQRSRSKVGLTDAFMMAEREEMGYAQEERGNTPAPLDTEEDTMDTRNGSPSPAPVLRERPYSSGQQVGSGPGSFADPREEEWERAKLRNQKDEERIRRTLNRNAPTLVQEDKVGPVIYQTAQTLERKSSASRFDDMPEPSMRLPKEWGLRAKQTAGAIWMRKILTPDPSLEIKDDQHATGHQNQAFAADNPLPTIEDVSGLQPTPPTSRPASAQPLFTSPEKNRAWDLDNDFTGASIQISSPQLRIKPSTRLDEIRDREIQSLSARAVATNRLEEIRERNSEERSVREESSRPVKEQEPNTVMDTIEEPYEHERTIIEEEGIPIEGTPVTWFPKGAYRPKPGSSVITNDPKEDSWDTLRKLSRVASVSPHPRRDESHSDEDREPPIKKVRSRSPPNERRVEKTIGQSVVKPEETLLEKQNEKPVGKRLEKVMETSSRSSSQNNRLDLAAKRLSTNSTPPKSDVDPEERITAEAKLFELQDNKSERNSIRAPSRSPSPSGDEKFDETPKPKPDPLSLPTPRVTGAYIETPATAIGRTRKARSNSRLGKYSSQLYGVAHVHESGSSASEDEDGDKRFKANARISDLAEDQKAPLVRNLVTRLDSRESRSQATKVQPRSQTARSQEPPALINSAKLTTAAEDLRRLKLEGNYEDSTLDDFAAMTGDIGTTEVKELIIDLEYDERGLPLSTEEKARRVDLLLLQRMNQHLKNTSSSIRDAKQGIERLEHQVSSSNWGAVQEKDDRLYIKVPLPRLWIENPQAKNPSERTSFRNWKFTWIGLILAIFAAWLAAEWTTCEIYCHPKQSTVNNWQMSDPFFPWAIPTKLDQWTGEIVSRAVNKAWDATDEFLGPPKHMRRPPGRPLGAYDWWNGRDGPAPIVRDDGIGGGSIFNDELI